jgi:hypothetical protein
MSISISCVFVITFSSNIFSNPFRQDHHLFKSSYLPSNTMVAFGKILTSAMAMAVPVIAQLTPAQVVSNINMITQKSQALQAPAQSITIINGPLIIIGQGPFPQIIAGFTDIVSTATTAIAQMQGMAPVPAGQPSDDIFDAFREVRDVVPCHSSVADACS